ncbi:hypothetical protein IV38_GL001090 [Lactobacillus selangorensis]|uniref:N-acetyltransferase domain-containing protein n=1 Tax=Lactobacillus selangorensis TaxID=81857 RepID=A0A0R2FJS1_9LACO|nr:GNAT family N-acetyltransferase [Lactobacillus selangorensis]KRN28882.1 hypothetical protein IV38_GL001090 [Lactobacillus selangorensis]KRN32708.1 hypothetical protein IV40_GL000763 [Lactobacillus selangorensis]
MKIRPAHRQDVKTIAYLHVTCWQATYQDLLPQTEIERHTLASRTRLWEQRYARDHVLLLFDDYGEAVGFAAGGRSRTADYPEMGEVYALYLLPKTQKKGYGRALLQAMRLRLSHLGYAETIVVALKTNVNAVHFYEHMGAYPVGERNDPYPEVVLKF